MGAPAWFARSGQQDERWWPVTAPPPRPSKWPKPIFNEGLKAVVAGVNPIQMKSGIEKAVADITDKLHKMMIKIRDKSEMANVATIAANNDREIGNLLADAMEKVGKDGVVTVDEGKSLHTELEFVEGMQFDRGYLSPYFVTDMSSMEAVLEILTSWSSKRRSRTSRIWFHCWSKLFNKASRC